MNPAILTLGAFAALALAGVLGWLAARRGGIRVLWVVLALGAVIAVAGWLVTRQPLVGDAAIRRQIVIYFMMLPGFVGLVIGAAIGTLSAPR